MRVACCQVRSTVGDPEDNARRMAAAIEAALREDARIIVLPELVNSGYTFASAAEARASAEPLEGPTVSGWRALAREHDVVIAGGFCELADSGAVFNSAVVVDADGIRAHYRKVHLWAAEQDWFTPGEDPPPVVDTRHGRLGLAVCYDLEFPELTRGIALAGAELLLLPTNWPRLPRPTGKQPMLMTITASIARLNRMFVAVCDRSDSDRGLQFEGSSIIVGPDGWALAEPPVLGADALLLAECDLGRARDKRTGIRNDAFADRRPRAYSADLLG